MKVILTDEMIKLHSVAQMFEAIGAWYMAEILRAELGRLVKEQKNG